MANTKRARTTSGASASASSQARRSRSQNPDTLDRTRFCHIDCQKRFHKTLATKNAIPERRINLSTDSYKSFEEEIEKRQWTKLLEDPPVAYKQIVREFYANLLKENHAGLPINCVYVRGTWVHFHAHDINRYLGLHINPPDEYFQLLSQNLDWDEVKDVISAPGSEWTYTLQPSTKPKHLSNRFLNRDARVWAQVMFSRLLPNSHTSSVTIEHCVLLYCLMTGREIDLGRLIANHTRTIPTRNASLPYPSLITAMVLHQGAHIHPTDEMVPQPPPICETSMQTAVQKAQRRRKRELRARAATSTSAAPPPAHPRRVPTPPPTEPSLIQLQGQIDALRLDLRSHRNQTTRQFSALYGGMRSIDARLEALMRHQLPPELLAQFPPIPAVDPALERLYEDGEPADAVADESEESEEVDDSGTEESEGADDMENEEEASEDD